jgi:hypothetical protein
MIAQLESSSSVFKKITEMKGTLDEFLINYLSEYCTLLAVLLLCRILQSRFTSLVLDDFSKYFDESMALILLSLHHSDNPTLELQVFLI